MDKIIESLQQVLNGDLENVQNKLTELDILKRRIKDKENEIVQLTSKIEEYKKAIKKLKDNNE